MKIKILSATTINRIAAGEVIERPASAVKELIENSIDAGASQVDVALASAGRNLISVIDNGCGMSKEELELAVERHTTSKLDETNLLNILHFGFRGEALPSIASVCRMSITSRTKDEDMAWKIQVNGGEKQPVIPASLISGTHVEIRDLFFATPARLKFLKAERTEIQHTIDIINRLALAHPNVAFSLTSENKNLIKTSTTNLKLDRISEIIGKEFAENSVEINSSHDGVIITGYASLPTYNRGNSTEQYLFVNNRPVRDKLLITAVKIAYQDFLANHRYPVVVLFVEIPVEEVDVNVHPTKAEVRFRDSNNVRGLIIRAIKSALATAAHRSSTTIATNTLEKFIPNIPPMNPFVFTKDFQTSSFHEPVRNYSSAIAPAPIKIEQEVQVLERPIPEISYPLGFARCQLHTTYIVAETKNSIVIVDQHAAHERLVYEQLKQEQTNVSKQRLLIPEIIELEGKILYLIMEFKNELQNLGVTIEQCGDKAIIVSEVPALIKQTNITKLIKDIGDDLVEYGENVTLSKLTEHILETFACHHSIRAGRELNTHEMNALLREMEKTPYSGQCNHGRPTYVELKLSDIEKLFGRS